MFAVQFRRVTMLAIIVGVSLLTITGCDLGTYSSRSSQNGAASTAGSGTQTPPVDGDAKTDG